METNQTAHSRLDALQLVIDQAHQALTRHGVPRALGVSSAPATLVERVEWLAAEQPMGVRMEGLHNELTWALANSEKWRQQARLFEAELQKIAAGGAK